DDASSGCTSPGTPAWQTTVRDNAAGEQYWSTAVNSRPAYDANGDGTVWIRSTSSVQCDKTSIVSQVGKSSTAMDFPLNTVSANWFKTANQGRKVIVDTLGAYAQPPSIRPSGTAAQPAPIV